MSYFTEQAQQAATQQLQSSDGMLMGRGTYEYFAEAPPTSGAYADTINAIPKYVFSSTLERAEWNNSTIIRGDAVTAISELKQRDGRDLVMYGHGRLSQTLLEHDLLDEISFAIHPVLLGHGQPATSGQRTPPLLLHTATPLPTGVVVLSYEPTKLRA